MHISDHFHHNFLFDSHCHLNFEGYDNDRDKIVEDAQAAGVELIIDIGTDLKASQKAIDNAIKYKDVVFAFVGVDPEIFIPGSDMFAGLGQDDKWFNKQYEDLSQLVSQNSKLVTGIGETGLDYYWLTPPPGRGQGGGIPSELANKSTIFQNKLFKLHLNLASDLKLPVSVHSRGAEKECLEIIKNYPNVTGIFHSYTGDYETAQKILDLGWGLGVNGIITFKNASNLREMYKKILGEISPDWSYIDFYKRGIFFETDSPFLSPDRGGTNEPANVRKVYEKVKRLQEIRD